MDPLLIAVTSLGVLVILTSSLWWRAGRGRRRARRAAAESAKVLKRAESSIETLRVGEREAAWSATATANRLDRNMIELNKATHDVTRLESDLDELRTHLGAADQELGQLRRIANETSTEIANLEGDLDRSRLEADQAGRRIEALEGVEDRLSAVVEERDRLDAEADRSERLEAELAALGQVAQDLAAARADNAKLRRDAEASDASSSGDVARLESELLDLRSLLDQQQADDGPLIAAEAARRDLESRLAAVTAARKAEQGAARERITRLERLHAQIADRDRRIRELEGQSSSPAADPALDGRGEAVSETTGRAATYAEWDQTMRARVAASVEEATARLREQVQHLRTVIAEKERLLRSKAGSPVAARPGPMPVTDIKGIGPVIAAILAGHGITTVDQVAALSNEAIERLGRAMPVYPDRIRADDWVGQAQRLLGHT